jgi:hypothetical protein
MKKLTFRKRLSVLKALLSFLFSLNLLLCFGQKTYDVGVGQEYYIYRDAQSFLVPLVYFKSHNNWYASFRYNYEESQTFSFQFGKTFSKEGPVSYSVTPLAGLLAGKFQGLSIGTLAEMETGKFSFYTEPEYCIRLNNPSENFFYNWTELSVQPSKIFYTGFALQTIEYKQEPLYLEPGIMLGITIKNFEVPLYLFKTSASSNYFVIGLHWSMEK